ncbi:MAG: group 1 glycosyl transferase, partial [Archaeoglobales archaeon]
MRIGFVSRYPPVHCGVAEYTKMLSSALKSLSHRIEVFVFSTREIER